MGPVQKIQIDTITFPVPWGAGSLNVYALSTSSGVVLVDCGYDDDISWELLRGGLADRGWDLEDLSAIVLTHSHVDHLGRANQLRRELDIPVYIHEAEREAVAKQLNRWGRNPQCMGRFLEEHGVPRELVESLWPPKSAGGSQPATAPGNGRETADPTLRAIKDGDVLTFGDVTLRAVHCPGHSPGSTVYWHADSQTLFSGDHLIKGFSFSPLIYFLDDDYNKRTRSLPDYLASLEKVLALPARRVLPGHGQEFGDLPTVVESYRRHHARRTNRILQLLSDGPMSAFDILQTLFPHLRPDRVPLGLFDVIGHLDVLVDERRVVEEKREGRYYYRATDWR